MTVRELYDYATTKGGHLIDEIDLFVDCSIQRLEIIP